jgi:hypothetical protein
LQTSIFIALDEEGVAFWDAAQDMHSANNLRERIMASTITRDNSSRNAAIHHMHMGSGSKKNSSGNFVTIIFVLIIRNKILKAIGGLKETHELSGSFAVDRLLLGEVSDVVNVEFGPHFGQLLVGL